MEDSFIDSKLFKKDIKNLILFMLINIKIREIAVKVTPLEPLVSTLSV